MSSLHDHNFKDLPSDWRHDGPLSARNDEKHMPAVTPPTVHDSDRKAAEEIMRARLCPIVSEAAKELALIIARHHAEERAAVERAREALEEISTMAHCISLSGPATTPTLQDAWGKFDRISVMATAALTALRTASWSPTEGKT